MSKTTLPKAVKKPEVKVETAAKPAIKLPKMPIVDNLGDNWLLKRVVNQFLARDVEGNIDRDLKARLLACATWAEVKKIIGDDAKVYRAVDAMMDYYGSSK